MRFRPRAIYPKQRNQIRCQQHASVAESLDSDIAHLREKGFDVARASKSLSLGLRLNQRLSSACVDMPDRMVNGLGHGFVDRLSVFTDPGTRLKRQRQHAPAKIQQDRLMAVNHLGGRLHPPGDTVRISQHDRVGHGLHQRMPHSRQDRKCQAFFAPGLQGFSPAFAPAKAPLGPSRTGQRNYGRSECDRSRAKCLHRKRRRFGCGLLEPVDQVRSLARCDVDITACLQSPGRRCRSSNERTRLVRCWPIAIRDLQSTGCRTRCEAALTKLTATLAQLGETQPDRVIHQRLPALRLEVISVHVPRRTGQESPLPERGTS